MILFSYFLTDKHRKRIPAEGKLISVANHPLGALDAFAVLKPIGEIRRDVKMVANDVPANLTNLKELFVLFDIFSNRPQKDHISRIGKALLNDEAVIFFPAAEVSRLTFGGIKDKP